MKRSTRPGFTFVELLAAIVVISALLIVVTQMLTLVVDRTRANQRHVAASEVAASVMEVVTAQPFDAIDSKAPDSPEIRDVLLHRLQDWRLKLEVRKTTEPLAGKHLRLSILWKNSRPHHRPVVITAWKFAGSQP